MFIYKHFVKGDATSELDDIARNLNNVLRSKRGSGYFLPEFGIDDVGFRTPEEMVVSLSGSIERNVRLFEPRVEFLGTEEDHDEEGKRIRLVVNLRVRESNDRLALSVDLGTMSFDIKPVRSS